jgi:hypothetical protein
VRIETPEPIEFREASATELSITTIALRLYPKMIELSVYNIDDDYDFELPARQAHEAARAFMRESLRQEDSLVTH